MSNRAMDYRFLGILWLFWMTRNKYTKIAVRQKEVGHGTLAVQERKAKSQP